MSQRDAPSGQHGQAGEEHIAPAGIEDYFAALTQLLTAENDAARAEAAALMAQHDMVVPDDDRAAYGALG